MKQFLLGGIAALCALSSYGQESVVVTDKPSEPISVSNHDINRGGEEFLLSHLSVGLRVSTWGGSVFRQLHLSTSILSCVPE